MDAPCLLQELRWLEEFLSPGDFLGWGVAVSEGRAHQADDRVGVLVDIVQDVLSYFFQKMRHGWRRLCGGWARVELIEIAVE